VENVAAEGIELSRSDLDQLAGAGSAAGDRYRDMSRING
jgi:hypothetical protein